MNTFSVDPNSEAAVNQRVKRQSTESRHPGESGESDGPPAVWDGWAQLYLYQELLRFRDPGVIND